MRWRDGCDEELLRAGYDEELLRCTPPVMQIYYLRLSLPHRLHTSANGPIRVLLVLVSTEIKTSLSLNVNYFTD